MKKLLICTLAAIVLSNCDISVKQSKAQTGYSHVYDYKEVVIEGMKYGIWYVTSQTSQTGYATSVINLTKDSLECAVLRQQLKSK